MAHNNFVSGRLLSRLSHYLPTLANLSLQGNKFSAWKDLDHISGRKGKLSQLKELILLDNPLRNIEYGKDSERYKRPVNSFHSSPCIAYYLCSQVARRFPSLEMLDMEPIPKIAFDVPHASASHAMPAGPAPTTFPVDMGESFIAGVDGGLLSGFLMRYVECVPVRSMAVLMAGSDSCLCLIISVQRLWTSTIPTPHSPIQPIPPSLLVPELKGTFIQRACRISASRTGLDGGLANSEGHAISAVSREAVLINLSSRCMSVLKRLSKPWRSYPLRSTMWRARLRNSASTHGPCNRAMRHSSS